MPAYAEIAGGGQPGGGGNKKIRDQPRALEPIPSKEIKLSPESVGRYL